MNALKTGGIEHIKNFDQLFPFLRDILEWPIEESDFEIDELTFEYDAAKDLGLKKDDIAHIREIRQLRPLVTDQTWGIFFVSFEDRKIPVGVLKRILGGLTLKKRQSTRNAEQKGWNLHDLLFISASGDTGERGLSFLHFTEEKGNNKIILRELGWDRRDTKTKQAYVYGTLKEHLSWPADAAGFEKWTQAFTTGYGEVIASSKMLTKRLAELACRIREAATGILKAESKNGSLTKIFNDFRKTIFHNLTPADFADMYAQTICYGLLVVQINRQKQGLDTKNLSADDAASHTSSVIHPFLQELMESFLAVGGRKSKMDFNELGVNEVVELLQQANMKAVVLDFGNKNPNEDPVLHFYEHFLKDYDSIMREQRGVYYTPLPVVSFIVRSVDEILQKELGLEDGLADTTTWGEIHKRNPEIKVPANVSEDAPVVQILDPATGTGTFLVETIGLIEKRMKEKWCKAGQNEREVETLWNDYVPKHLLPRLNGFELMMAPYAIAHIKIGMKLAETGYEPKDGQQERVRVYLTNTLEKSTAADDQRELSFIKESLAQEARGADNVKDNVPITVVLGNPPYANYSSNLSVEVRKLVDKYRKYNGVVIRERNQLQFERNLQDDLVKFISVGEGFIERANFGVLGFITNATMLASRSLRGMREHILKCFDDLYELNLHGGVNEIIGASEVDENVFNISQSVGIHIYSKSFGHMTNDVKYSDFFGRRKDKFKYLSNTDISNVDWLSIKPDSENCSFLPNSDVDVSEMFRLDRVFAKYGAGIKTNRDLVAINYTEEQLVENVVQFCEELDGQPDLTEYIRPLLYRPFDIRRIFYHKKIVKSMSLPTMQHFGNGPNFGFVASSTWTTPKRFSVGISNAMLEMKAGTHDRGTTIFPLYRYESILIGDPKRVHNFTPEFCQKWCEITKTKLIDVGCGNLVDTTGPEDIMNFFYALFYSAEYRKKFQGKLSQGFPILFFPNGPKILSEMIALGRQLVALHLLDENEVPEFSKPDTRFVSAGEARVERGYPKYENGKVMINACCHFEDVTPDVWDFYIGGYQVCDKWLKSRAAKGGKNPHPGRVLSGEDILHYRRITVAIRETISVMKQVDGVINAHGGWPDAFYQAPSPPPSIEDIIQADENHELEFKSTFQWDVKEGKKNQDLQKPCLKTVAAFMNTKGGTLVIGVTDDKKIFGLKEDLKLTRGTTDMFEQTFRHAMDKCIGVACSPYCKIRFAEAPNNEQVCIVEISRSKQPVFLKFQGKEEFFIRRGNASKALSAVEQYDYIKQHFA